MIIRLKFEKQGNLKFIGHLDVMRAFQKLNLRSGADISYSGGFSPHQEMSFATPLGLGLTSYGEYVDIKMNSCPDKKTLIEKMNAVNLPDMKILDACLLPDDAKNAMSLLAAADYTVRFRDEENMTMEEIDTFFEDFFRFFDCETLVTEKKTKKSTKTVDLKQQVRLIERRGNSLFMQVDTGSASNLKPELLLETYYLSKGLEFDPFLFTVNREELYGEEDGVLKSLISYGTDF